MKHQHELIIDHTLTVGGYSFPASNVPESYQIRQDLGLLTHQCMEGKVIHIAEASESMLFETRATITPGGDYLLMFPEGEHYSRAAAKINDMLAYRSKDHGQTWQGPTIAFDIPFSQHGFIPFIPKGTDRLYCFGTQPITDQFTCENGQHENAPIGFRYSDDDGHTWSDTQWIRPINDPEFKGMSVMRMCETDQGTWLLGSHVGDWSQQPLVTHQYVLRSEDQGETWELLPGERAAGWNVPDFERMDEGRPIYLGDGKVLCLIRTPEGHLWETRSEDDGKTWTAPKPTALVHPDAPPMVFHLSNGQTLAAFHHNRHHDTDYSGLSADKQEAMKDRSEIWVSLSTDGGLTWSEPGFLFANALAPNLENPWRNYQCSYLDAFVDGDTLHLFFPHRWQQAVHLTMKVSGLQALSVKAQLGLHGSSR